MARYVDGFVIPIPKKNVTAYRRIAARAGRIWREHGAVEYLECVGEDLKAPHCKPFPRAIRVKAGETVLFSYIVYKSRAHRDKVNAKVMADPRMHEFMNQAMPFDPRRMLYGGFAAIVDL
jgi:uncharacterized protein YbaA (DUF1428 family)